MKENMNFLNTRKDIASLKDDDFVVIGILLIWRNFVICSVNCPRKGHLT